jgi:DNA (cytosine-5)-methyltransferase 1
MRAIDLFAGAGGMSVGAGLVGLEVTHAVEIDQNASATYRHNHPDTTVLTEDIRKVNADTFNGGSGHNEIDIIFGGPPCQGFSTSNQKTRSASNPANWLFREYVRIVEQIRPSWIVFENVKGLVETENGLFYRKVKQSIKKLGYTISSFVLNATDYGVPQKRSRLFIVGSRNNQILEIPQKSSVDKITVRDAIADLPSLEIGASIDFLPYTKNPVSTYAEWSRQDLVECGNNFVTRNSSDVAVRYAYVPQGGNWEDIPATLMKNYADRSRCHTGIYHRLREDEPSIVVGNFRKNMLIHPWQNRGLSVREAARLQSFPDSYHFYGSIGFQQQQVGNAVPPLLAKALFQEIIKTHEKRIS